MTRMIYDTNAPKVKTIKGMDGNISENYVTLCKFLAYSLGSSLILPYMKLAKFDLYSNGVLIDY